MMGEAEPEHTSAQPSLTTRLVGLRSSHSMSRVGSSPTQNWWWQGSVALSPTTLFISVWAHAVSTASRTVRTESQLGQQVCWYRAQVGSAPSGMRATGSTVTRIQWFLSGLPSSPLSR